MSRALKDGKALRICGEWGKGILRGVVGVRSPRQILTPNEAKVTRGPCAL